MRYAEVCVNTPLGGPTAPAGRSDDAPGGRTFTYAVPNRLADRLEPGHLVWVPFRGRRLQAVVLSLSDAVPTFDVREIIGLVWTQPPLTPTQLALAGWVAETTFAPLIEALRLMLPAGLAQRGRTVLVRTGPAAPGGLTPNQQALLARLELGEATWEEASVGLKKPTQRDDLEPLIEMGLAARETAFLKPPPRPKTDRLVRLLVPTEGIPAALRTLGRASKSADVLMWLAAAADAPGAAQSPGAIASDNRPRPVSTWDSRGSEPPAGPSRVEGGEQDGAPGSAADAAGAAPSAGAITEDNRPRPVSTWDSRGFEPPAGPNRVEGGEQDGAPGSAADAAGAAPSAGAIAEDNRPRPVSTRDSRGFEPPAGDAAGASSPPGGTAADGGRRAMKRPAMPGRNPMNRVDDGVGGDPDGAADAAEAAGASPPPVWIPAANRPRPVSTWVSRGFEPPAVEAPSAASSRGEPPEGGPSAAPSAPLPLAELTRATGATKDAIRKLAERGLVRLAPGADGREAVTLAVTDRALEDAIVALRRVEKHRAVLELLASHDGPLWIGRIYAETTATLETLRDLAEAGLVSVEEETVWRDPLAAMTIAHDRAPVLTRDQEQVWAAIAPWVGADSPQGRIPPGFLLHGVTGSGKTEIYLRAIARALASGRQAVVLVPEIALTPQTIRRFAARFPGVVTVWHSELGDGERFDIWRRVRTNHPAAQVVVGSRSALFLPFKALGVVVVDEEHEPTYKQERTPRYHARLAARELARLNAAPVILGSATPALESYYAARRGELLLLALPGRIVGHGSLPGAGEPAPLLPGLEGELPAVEIVDMRQELRAGNRSIFSRALSAGLRRVLDANQQAILYLNRRGAASFVLCRDCGHVEACPRCAVPLTYHGEGQQLLCHHCNRRYPVPAACPDCGGSRIRYFGAGTERVEEAVHLEFPAARTLRWDRDATGAKGSHDAILDRFVRHDADILIGTQMIAKGLDLPLVTLVGAVAADTGLYLPDFRAGERTFQLLTQVAGRAGRSALGGSVVIQTYHPDHYAIMAAANHDYEGFYRQEIAFRRELGYPPLSRLARLVYHTGQRTRAEEESRSLAAALRAGAAADPSASIIGPAPCYFAKIRNEYRWQIILRSEDPVALLSGVPIPLGWRVDVDPVDLL